MRRNLVRAIGSMVFVGLLMPAGMLLATATHQLSAVTSNSANWYDTEEASNLFNQMQMGALKVRKDVARLQVQEIQLSWQDQAQRLTRARSAINTIGDDLLRLDHIKDKVEPWQESLINKVTPEVHEMVYQTDDAINTVNAQQNRVTLAMTQYPQNINMIYKNANQMAGTITSVIRSAHAEEKMAALKQDTGGARS